MHDLQLSYNVFPDLFLCLDMNDLSYPHVASAQPGIVETLLPFGP